MAAVLISVGTGIIDRDAIGHLGKGLNANNIVMMVVFFLTIFADLVIAVAAGFILHRLLARF